jgi:hypothetical protein
MCVWHTVSGLVSAVPTARHLLRYVFPLENDMLFSDHVLWSSITTALVHVRG